MKSIKSPCGQDGSKPSGFSRWPARRKAFLPAGALSLLRGDAKTQGPRLFQQYCASCHSYADPEDKTCGPTPPTAPNLYGYASRRWFAGLLDPKQILGPRYFGNTKLRDMAGFVKDSLGKLDESEKQDLEER